MANSTDYLVRVVFQTVLGNLNRDTRRIVDNLRDIGSNGQRAGREGSDGLDDLSDSADDASDRLRETEGAASRLSNTLKTALKAAVVGFAAKQIADFGVAAVNEYGKTQKALGEVASLGLKDLETLEKAAVDFSNTWSGTTREDFISAAYDIKSGIASLSDEGVAKFTEMAGLTAKATKSSIGQMTSLFAKAHAVYRNQFTSDTGFGEAFSASISKATQLFRTEGSEMESYLSSLGASAANAGVSLEEVVNIGGVMQTQAGTTGSESATQYATFLRTALSASQKLGMSFTDNNGRLLPAIDIVEQIRNRFGDTLEAVEKFELKQAFGDDTALEFVDNLYNKIDATRQGQLEVNQAMQEGISATKTMASYMNQGVLEKVDLIKQSWANVLNVMGKQISPGIMPGLDSLHQTLIDLQNSGDFTRLGESLGKLVQAGTQLFNSVLANAPGAINALADAVQWLADNLDLITFAVKTAATAFVAFKAASAITKIFGVIGGAITKVIGLFRSGTGVMSIFKTALKAGFKTNALGLIITLVISLIGWFLKATEGVTGFKDKCMAAWYDIGIKFNSMISGLMKGLKKFIGFFGAKWQWVDDLIADSEKRIADLEGKKAALRDDGKPRNNVMAGMVVKAADQIGKVILSQQSNSGSGGAGSSDGSVGSVGSDEYSSGGGSGSSGSPTTIQDRIDAIDDRYSTSVDNAEIKADLAEGDNKTAEAKSYKQAAIDYLKQQAADLLRLEGSQSGNNKTLVENARLNIMKKIQDLTQDIRDGVNKMSGDFNTPSDIVAMTKYQYLTQKGGTGTGQYFSNGNVEMYFSIKNPDALSEEQLKNYINNWAATGAMTAGNISYSQAKAMADQVLGY